MKAYIHSNNLSGAVSVPGSKSHTIRAVLFGLLADGVSTIKNPLPSKDGLASVNVARLYGGKCQLDGNLWSVEGVGGELKVPDDVIDVENSGTTLYFATTLAALLKEWVVLTGDEQIRRRPIEKLLAALTDLGAVAEPTRAGVDAAPAVVKGPIGPGTAHLDGRLSQYVSAMLMAAPLVDGTVRVELEDPKEIPYVEITLSWLDRCGIKYTYDEKEHKYYEITGPQKYGNFDVVIPCDWSGVAFPLVAAVVTDSEVVIEDLNFEDKQGDAKIIDFLIEMGADITIDRDNNRLIAKGGKELHGITVDLSNTPDALPALSVAAAYAKGKTVFTGTKIIRKKETDRVAVMAENLALMNVKTEATDDTMTVYGTSSLKGAVVKSHDDHRVAMALSVAGLFAEGETVVEEAECVSVSFPNFYEVMNNIGADMVLKD